MGVANIRGLDWMIGFFDHPFRITHNHNKLQYPTINLQPNTSSLTAEDSIHYDYDSVLYYLYSLEEDPHKPRQFPNNGRLLLSRKRVT
jgi:hypothetical protein